jgi:cytochrome c oxidase subunit IV
MTEPVVSVKTYALIFMSLLGLTLTTTLLAYIDLGVFNMVIAITIAVIKATLIVSFFMHALYEFKLVHVIIAGGILWFLILVFVTLGDYLTRARFP